MAIVQISRITQRKGLQENLPQLAGAEFGWSIDERRLFIGNGTLEEGAPVIGNTEILTEFSDIFAFQTNYTYKGEAAGYTVQTGPTPGDPVSQSLQSWLDQFATVKDFGAVGDGIADDTDAINRALYQLFCREINPQIRRSLFFPAGVYRVTRSINIPPYATLWGEGASNSVIQLDIGDDSTLHECVARTADSLQQIGAQIGTNGAITPQYVTVMNMGFSSLDPTVNVFLVEDAKNCEFRNVNFTGPLTTADLDTDGDDTRAVAFDSTASLVCENIKFDGCLFAGCTYGIDTDEQLKAVTVTASKFDTLYRGVTLGINTVILGGATGVRLVENMFNNIYAEGIIFGDVQLNASGYNIFYDVGNFFGGVGNPETPIIDIQNNNNVSISDMFERGDPAALIQPRINLNDTTSIAMINGKQLSLGTYTIESGLQTTLINNFTNAVIGSVSTNIRRSFVINYTIIRDTARRTGTIQVSTQTDGSFGNPIASDDYVENTSTGITFSFVQTGTVASWRYTATNTGVDATLYYSITSLS